MHNGRLSGNIVPASFFAVLISLKGADKEFT